MIFPNLFDIYSEFSELSSLFGEDESRSLVNNERQIRKGGGLKCRCRGTAGGNVEKNVEKGGEKNEKDRKIRTYLIFWCNILFSIFADIGTSCIV